MSKFLILIVLFGFSIPKNTHIQESYIKCTDAGCFGTYKGPEFINRSDVAHQFSNEMSAMVGEKLKELYHNGLFSKVDFDGIEMTTEGMGTGTVTYYLNIPFIPVESKCEAFTSFDHVGGWNHYPELEKRKKELSTALMDGEKLSVSELKTTREGLQEFWIQWKNKLTQSECQ